MGLPFKITGAPKGPGGARETLRVPQNIPGRRNPALNGDGGDVAPDHEPVLPWPAAPGTTTNPIRK